MNCNHCGQLLTAGSRFCSYCGASTEQGQPTVCPRCGAPVAANATYCSSCGTARYGGIPTPAVPGGPPYYPRAPQGERKEGYCKKPCLSLAACHCSPDEKQQEARDNPSTCPHPSIFRSMGGSPTESRCHRCCNNGTSILESATTGRTRVTSIRPRATRDGGCCWCFGKNKALSLSIVW